MFDLLVVFLQMCAIIWLLALGCITVLALIIGIPVWITTKLAGYYVSGRGSSVDEVADIQTKYISFEEAMETTLNDYIKTDVTATLAWHEVMFGKKEVVDADR